MGCPRSKASKIPLSWRDVVTRTEGISINDLERVCSRIGLQSTEILLHILPIGKSILQVEWNRLCSHKARGDVDNDSVEHLVSTVYVPSMGSWEVGVRYLNIGKSK